jgi:hypothetical protein
MPSPHAPAPHHEGWEPPQLQLGAAPAPAQGRVEKVGPTLELRRLKRTHTRTPTYYTCAREKILLLFFFLRGVCAVVCAVVCVVVCVVSCVVTLLSALCLCGFRCVVSCVVSCAVGCAVGCVVDVSRAGHASSSRRRTERALSAVSVHRGSIQPPAFGGSAWEVHAHGRPPDIRLGRR